MKTVLLFLTILILSGTNLYSQHDRSRLLPEEINVLNDFTKPALMDSTELDSLIISAMNTIHIPGLAALITTKEDGIMWKRNYGFADVTSNQPVEDSTLFIIASISKTIVATAIMQFWEADSFDLDDNINDYLDDFQVNIPSFENDTITFRMLLTHTSSIEDNWGVLDALTICGDSPIPLDSFLVEYFTPGGIYYNSTLNFISATPGTVWEYSNVAVCILAHLVEKFSGMSFDQYCRDNIFLPLGMYKTSWFLAGLDTTTIATPYKWQGGQYIPYCQYGCPDYPDGQLRTTKIELEHFLSAYMNWGQYNGETILDSSTVDLILSDHLGYPIYGGDQGLIWFQDARLGNRLPWGHTGGCFGCNTGMFFKQYEDQGWGIICFMNSAPGSSALVYMLNLLCDYAEDLTDVEENFNILTDFYLEQNYPNPFNPTTTIKYQIPELSRVTLKVYDVLGNEIANLVNEEKSIGSYQIEFDGSKLSSGVYFYQLKAGSYGETKKMVLLR